MEQHWWGEWSSTDENQRIQNNRAQDWSNERKRLNGWGLQDLKVTSTRPIHLLQNAGPTSRPYKMTSLVKLKSITWRCEFHLICLRRASNSPEQPSKQHSLSYYCCSNESNWFNSNIHRLQNIKPYQNNENENPWWITFCHRHVAQRSSLALHLQGCIQIQHWVNLIFFTAIGIPFGLVGVACSHQILCNLLDQAQPPLADRLTLPQTLLNQLQVVPHHLAIGLGRGSVPVPELNGRGKEMENR